DGRRGGVSDPQERLADPPNLASVRPSRFGAHPGLLFGVRTVESIATNGPRRGLGRRAASRAGRVEPDQPGGRGAAHALRSGNSPPLHHPADRPPGHPPPTPGPSSPSTEKRLIEM